ncbi:MAG: hypothetical protein ABJF23_15420 [Bryobacteraceae bacterium]
MPAAPQSAARTAELCAAMGEIDYGGDQGGAAAEMKPKSLVLVVSPVD